MKTPIIAAAAATAFLLAGCDTHNQTTGTAVGAVAGAAVGGLTSGSVAGAMVGGAAGALAGNLLGRAADEQGKCIYQDRSGNRYTADCPANM